MKNRSAFAMFVSGIALGTLIVVACSDDSPGDADAATCDCPAAEPPLAGRITRQRATTAPIQPMDSALAGATCPAGATVLGGSCRLMNGNTAIYLSEAGFINTGEGYRCVWKSTSNQVDTGIAEAICLMPAQ